MTGQEPHPPTLAAAFEPPYYAVIFTTLRAPSSDQGYAQTAAEMVELALGQDGFLGIDSAYSEGLGVTVSYWRDEAAIAAWKAHGDHQAARQAGRAKWYRAYQLRVAKVERAYGWPGAEDK